VLRSLTFWSKLGSSFRKILVSEGLLIRLSYKSMWRKKVAPIPSLRASICLAPRPMFRKEKPPSSFMPFMSLDITGSGLVPNSLHFIM